MKQPIKIISRLLSKQVLFLGLLISLLVNIYFFVKNNNPSNLNPNISKQLVVRVIDGDTFDIEGAKRVRLAGANAPEYPKDCLSEAAKQRLEQLIAGKTAVVEITQKDPFGRLLAFTFVDDLFIDKALVEEGLAQASAPSHPKYGVELLEAQTTAQKAARGIWSAMCQKPQDAKCNIKGNVRRDRQTKVYHLPACYNYEKIVIDQSEGDQWFCTEAQAQAVGFVKSQDCPNSH